MQISVVIPTLRVGDHLSKCLASIEGQYDELIVIDEKIDNLAKKINKGLEESKGDFIIVLNDDVILSQGTLNKMCYLDGVTSPLIRGGLPMGKVFHAHAWGIPRHIYEDIGGMWEGYDGFYYDDSDYQLMIETKGHKIIVVEDVDFYHPPEGGTTLHTFPDWADKYARNQEMFRQRWG